ncbi:HDOD domain-containing protein [Massilia sp. HP4]|uniref:HDOD domain-containing protein n=1 Tax=Massilia sp. HP4 TaxID=2562316 RepID=UPI0010C0F11F|nr:HDOD domain-containing protein [Massilia sp. HP4]
MTELPQDGASRRVRPALMRKLSGTERMFTLGGAVMHVIGMGYSDDQGTADLAYYVVSDVALTQRILRLSNTVQYRTLSNTPVTTISRAISLLGFDNVRAAALAMLLVDALDTAEHGVRVELEASLCASLVGRELARHSPIPGAEEAAICALFKNLGALLLASHEPERYREIAALVAAGKHTPSQAAQLILGCSFEALSEAVLREWQMPALIVQAQAALPAGPLEVAAERNEWMRQVAAFSRDVARLMGRHHDPAAAPETQDLIARYGAALGVDHPAMVALFDEVQDGMNGMLQSMNLERAPKTDPKAGSGMPNVLALATLDAGEDDEGECYPSGKPKNARDLLLAGVQDVTLLGATGAGVNDVIMAVLETLYGALGFRFATVCLRDTRTRQFRARVSLGEGSVDLQDGFVFPCAFARDVFHLALENDADMMIADAFSPKIRDLLPAWYKTLLPDAESFIVLPLVVGKAQLGLVYADRVFTAPEGVAPDETALIKALKAQLLAALAPAGTNAQQP